MPQSPNAHAQIAVTHLLGLPEGRKLIALAGPPGSGKSTVAAVIAAQLAAAGKRAAVVPMDGFHLDNEALDEMGLRHRKGAPETFNALGFCHLIADLARGGQDVVYPVFDRHLDRAIADAATLDASVEFVIVEGNYLLLQEPPWDQLAQHWTTTLWIQTPLEELRRRLMRRWQDEALSPEQAREKVDGNDLPNAQRAQSQSAPADIVLQSMDAP